MQKIKKVILLVLLFSFTFLVGHDYVMADIDKSSYQLISSEKLSEHTAEELCMLSHLHDSIHTMITIEQGSILNESLEVDERLSYTKLPLSSYNKFVLERPPLS